MFSHVSWWFLWGLGTNHWSHCQSQTGSVAQSLDESSPEDNKRTFTIDQTLRQERFSWSWHLNDVLLAGLVLRSPFHWSPSQVHCELRLRLVAAKLLETNKKDSFFNSQTIMFGQSSQIRAARPDSVNMYISYDWCNMSCIFNWIKLTDLLMVATLNLWLFEH